MSGDVYGGTPEQGVWYDLLVSDRANGLSGTLAASSEAIARAAAAVLVQNGYIVTIRRFTEKKELWWESERHEGGEPGVKRKEGRCPTCDQPWVSCGGNH